MVEEYEIGDILGESTVAVLSDGNNVTSIAICELLKPTLRAWGQNKPFLERLDYSLIDRQC